MKSLFPLLILALIFTGCQKSGNNPEPQTEVKKMEVTFMVADFDQSVKGFAAVNTKGTMAVGDTLSNYADNLYYAIYAADGSYVKSATQSKANANFGRITEQLPPGTYDVFLVATKNGFGSFAGTGSTYSTASFSPPIANNWSEFFSKNINITVAGTPLTQNVRLDRAVGRLDVVLLQEMPSTVSKISITVDKEASDMLFKTGLPTTYASTKRDFTIPAADAGVKNRAYSVLTVNTATDINVTIQAFDAAGAKLAEKVVTTRVNKSQRTTLSGNLFSPAEANFTVFVNPLWNPSGAVVTF
jgi:hypothetical protein